MFACTLRRLDDLFTEEMMMLTGRARPRSSSFLFWTQADARDSNSRDGVRARPVFVGFPPPCGAASGHMTRRPHSLKAAWLVCVLLFSTAAHAQEKRLNVTLSYDALDSCPNTSEFKGIVSKRLGRDPFVDDAPKRVSAVISSEGGELVGKLLWRDSAGNITGEQNFPSKTNRCAPVAAAMGFSLAVQIQLLEDDSVEPQPAIETPPVLTQPKREPQPTQIAPAATRVDAVARRGTSAASFAVGGGVSAFSGMSSNLVPDARVFGSARWPAFALELGIELSAPVTVRREDGAGVSQWYLLSSVAGCGRIAPFRACGVFKAGTVRATGRDIDLPKTATAVLTQSGLRLGLEQRLSERAYLSFDADGLVNLTRWSVSLDHVPTWTSPRFAFGAGISLLVLFR